MSTPQPGSTPQAPQITTTSPAGHTTAIPGSPPAQSTDVPTQPTATAPAPAPNAPTTTLPPTPGNPALDSPTYNEQLNAVDRYWKFKMALQTAVIFAGLIGIGCIAWAVDTTSKLPDEYMYGYDSTWSLPWGLITFAISVIWAMVCIALLVFRKRPAHPGIRVTMDLLLWLGFIGTALLTLVALFDVLYWGSSGSLGSSWSGSSRYGDYVLQRNNTWVWEQSSDYSGVTGFDRSCNGSSATSPYNGNYYYATLPFANCAEMDAFVNALWRQKPLLARVELTAVVCQFLALVLHFALFVWACVDCHKHRRSRVSSDAEKLAAGIVHRMVSSGAIIPPPGQSSANPTQNTPPPAWLHQYYQLPSQPNSIAGQGRGTHPAMYAQQQQQQQQQQQMRYQHRSGHEGPLPPLPPRPAPTQAGPSNEKAGGVAASYYEPGR